MIKINGVDMPTPKSYEVSINDIDGENSNRDLTGIMYRDRIATKRKLTMEWAPLTQENSSLLLNAVTSTFFDCTFPDPKEGITTKTMYVGDRTVPMLTFINGVPRWSGIKMNFIER